MSESGDEHRKLEVEPTLQSYAVNPSAEKEAEEESAKNHTVNEPTVILEDAGQPASFLPLPYNRSSLSVDDLMQNNQVAETQDSGNAYSFSRQVPEISHRLRGRANTTGHYMRSTQQMDWQRPTSGSALKNEITHGFNSLDDSSFGQPRDTPTSFNLYGNSVVNQEQHYSNLANTRLRNAVNPVNSNNPRHNYSLQMASPDYSGNHSYHVNPAKDSFDLTPQSMPRSLSTPTVPSQPLMTRTHRTLHNQNNHGLHYNSPEEAREASRPKSRAVPPDATIPNSNEAKQRYVRYMVKAMLDMRAPQDNPGMVSQWRRMMEDGARIEQAAWHVLDLVLQVHRDGLPMVTNRPAASRYNSFKHRWNEICNGLRMQKTMCKHLCGTNFAEQLVHDPITASSRVKNNRKVNAGKKDAIIRGRIALYANEGDDQAGRRRLSSSSLARDDYSEFEDDEDDIWQQNTGLAVDDPQQNMPFDQNQSYSSPTASKPHARRQVKNEIESESDYQPSNKRPRKSRSKYQVNERGEMVDTSEEQFQYLVKNAPGRMTRRQLKDATSGHSHSRHSSYNFGEPSGALEVSASDDINSEEDAEGDVDNDYDFGGYASQQADFSVPSSGHRRLL